MRLLIITALIAAGGCATFSSGMTKITSEPPGALVTVEGFGTCETPCSIELDGPRYVTVAKAGYNAQRFRIAPGESKVSVELELVAPTEDVEETEMPEL